VSHLHLHPHLVRPVRVGSGILPDDVARRVVGYMIPADLGHRARHHHLAVVIGHGVRQRRPGPRLT